MNYIVIAVGLIISALLFRLYYWAKYGGAGEWMVANWYLSALSDEYEIFNDILLKTDDGSTHQIDHVVVSPYGIFVLEMKGYMGKVYGGQYSDQWTEYMGGKGYDFYNPIKQNYGHMKALQEVLGLPEKAFIPIVIFGRSATLKMDIDEKAEVIKTSDLVDTIRSYDKKLISDETQERIERLIKESNIEDKKIRQKHIESAASKTGANK
jgi:hypothetical protein